MNYLIEKDGSFGRVTFRKNVQGKDKGILLVLKSNGGYGNEYFGTLHIGKKEFTGFWGLDLDKCSQEIIKRYFN